MTLTRHAATGLALSALVTVGVHAHELGALETTLSLDRAGAFQLEMAVDPDALLTRLEVFGHQPVSGHLTRDERDRRILGLGAAFLDAVRVRFDGELARPAFHYRSNDGDRSEEPATVRLTGRIPRGANALVFSDELTMGTYAFRVLMDGRIASISWVARGEESPPVRLRRRPSVTPLALVDESGAAVASTVALACLALLWRARRGPARRSKLLPAAYVEDHRHARDQGIRVPRTVR